MTYMEALEIKVELTVAMQFADCRGKSRVEAFAEPVEKHSEEKLAEAYAILNQQLDEEKDTLKALFVLAIRAKRDRK
jgi:hypothetical protein